MRHLSYSQVKTFIIDPLTWVIQKLEHVKQPKTEALFFGSAYAHSIESVLTGQPYPKIGKYGENVPYDQRAMDLALQWTEENKDLIAAGDWQVEHEFEVYLDKNLPKFIGAMDLYTPASPFPKIIDFKTVSHSFEPYRKFWGLRDYQLPKDLQLMLYCHQACLENGIDTSTQEGRAIACEIGHEQIVKVKKNGEVVDFYLTRAQNYATINNIREGVGTLVEAAKEMVEVEREYKQNGIQSIITKYKATKKKRMFGKKCPYLDFIEGRETLKTLKDRYKNV